MARAPYILDNDKMRARLHALLDELDLKKPWAVSINPHRQKRSLNQNALYWRWISIVANDTGNDNDDLHEFFKSKFLAPRVVEIHGSVQEIRSTAKLTTEEMKLFMDRVYAWITSELGILLPLPEEQHVRVA